MKARKPSDPRSWFFQAAVHGVTEQAIAEAAAADPEVANVDQEKYWNQCPHFEALHATAPDFVVWHRAYLYYFERILREAAGAPGLALPYWNYLEAGQRTFPVDFAAPDRANPNGPPRNPLFDGRRENAFTAGLLELNPLAINANSALAETRFFADVGTNGFAGSATASEPTSQGLLERNPHNGVHFAIGGFIGSDPEGDSGIAGLMSDVTTAAFDPIFWIHHCNIDRLWSVWECLPGRVWGTAPEAAWFAARPWNFYDVDSQPKNEPRSFYMQQKNLGIVFDTDVARAPRLSDQLPANGSPLHFDLAAATKLKADGRFTASIASTSKPLVLLPKETTKAEVSLAAARPFGDAFDKVFALAYSRESRRILLIIPGLRYSRANGFV